MATVTERLAFLISADATNAIRAFEKTANSAKTKLGEAGNSTASFAQKFEMGMRRAAVPAAAAFATVTATLGFATKAAMEDAKAQTLLADQLVRSTGATQDAIAGNEEYIKTVMLSAAVTDDELRPAQAALVRATKDLTKSQRLLNLAVDISAATGRDLESVSLALSRAYLGQFSALKRLGIPIDEATMKSKDFEKVYSKLIDTFGGAGERAANTTAGRFKRLGITFNETKESIGAALLPAMESLSRVLQPLAAFAMRNASAFTAVLVAVGTLSATILAVNVVMRVYNTLQAVTVALNSALNASFTTLQVSMGVVAVALTAAVAAYTFVTRQKKDASKATREYSDALFVEGQAQIEAVRALTLAKPEFARLISFATSLGYTMDDLTQYLATGTGEFEDFAVVLYAAAAQTGDLSDATGILGSEFVSSAKKMRLSRSELNKMYFALENVSKEGFTVRQALAALKDFGAGGADTARRSFSSASNELKTLRTEIGKNFTSALDQAKRKLADAQQAFDGYRNSVAQAVRSQYSFSDAYQKANEGQGSFFSNLEDQAAKVRAFSDKVKTLIARGISKDALQQVLDAGATAGGAIADEIISGGADAITRVNTLTQSVQDAADAAGLSAASQWYGAGVTSAQNLVAGIESITAKYKLKLKSKQLTKKQLERLQKNFGVEVGFAFAGSGYEVPELAKGGIVNRPTLALIGERGPEAVVPLTGNNTPSMSTTYVTVNVTNADPRAVVDAIVRWSRQNGALPPQVKVG